VYYNYPNHVTAACSLDVFCPISRSLGRKSPVLSLLLVGGTQNGPVYNLIGKKSAK
jgi:hypothetical protein